MGPLKKKKKTQNKKLKLYRYPYLRGGSFKWWAVMGVGGGWEGGGGVGASSLFYSECGREAFRIFEGWGAYRLMEKSSLHKTM